MSTKNNFFKIETPLYSALDDRRNQRSGCGMGIDEAASG